jgi:hypothetical protein
MGTRCGVRNPKSAAVPATVGGELIRHHATGSEGPGKAAEKRSSREPGDLPPHVARSPGRDQPSNRISPLQRRGRPRAYAPRLSLLGASLGTMRAA